uniref:Helix-loop-helix protein n=1 Tax=Drosophila melanogaster TaxID=7227 RepID=Q24353_DROME|nr:helix-loop-helix protein [Drosophila melanogaster]
MSHMAAGPPQSISLSRYYLVDEDEMIGPNNRIWSTRTMRPVRRWISISVFRRNGVRNGRTTGTATAAHAGATSPTTPIAHLDPSELVGLSREERRRRRRATLKYRTAHATREGIRVEAFNVSFADVRKLLPTLPPDKKLSKIEILKLAICYIAYLNHVLETP